MTIRRRLFLSFFFILALFAVNIFIYRQGNVQRAESFDAVTRAVERQRWVIDIEQALAERRNSVADIRVLADAGVASLDEEEIADLTARLDSIEEQVGKLLVLPDPESAGRRAADADRPLVELFARRYDRLRDEWVAFYRSQQAVPAGESGVEAGDDEGGGAEVEPQEAVAEPGSEGAQEAVAEPGSEGEATVEEPESSVVVGIEELTRLAFEQLQVIKTNEHLRLDEATARFHTVADDTDRITLSIFGVSTLVALGVGLFLSAYLNRGLQALKSGARRIGAGDLEGRIAIHSRDELGELAEAFNAMSQRLKSARARVEEARAAAEGANRAKSTFLANMSHELRTPMNAIIGYTEMLTEDAEDLGQESFIPDLQKILAASKHLLSLINDVLDLSKIEAGKMTLFIEEFAVSELVDDVTATIKPLVAKNKNRIVIDVEPGAGVLTADETKVRQTLFNLLSNACKFTSEGTITVRAQRRSATGGDRLMFVISDTGIGMSREQMSRVFEEFTQADSSTTRKFGGTGLGLAISKKFCQLMGGDITVESEEGRGTHFTVDLPAVVVEPASEKTVSKKKAPAPAPTDSGSRAIPPGARSVLVIDDDPATLDITRRFLAREGFVVVTAGSGARGLELAREIKPTVITLDVMMPGMDGWAVLTALKDDPETADIPVIMLSMLDEKEMGFALGASEYMSKPFDRRRLAAHLGKYVGGGGRVLIVEDESDTRELMRRGLARGGWTIDEAENGLVALARLAETLPDLILLDLMMPQMDGFEFLDELRSTDAGQNIPVVVVTAKELTEEELSRLDGKVETILRKGAQSRDSLLGELRDLVARSITRGGGAQDA